MVAQGAEPEAQGFQIHPVVASLVTLIVSQAGSLLYYRWGDEPISTGHILDEEFEDGSPDPDDGPGSSSATATPD